MNYLNSLAEEIKGSNKKMNVSKYMTSSSWHEPLCVYIMKTIPKMRY